MKRAPVGYSSRSAGGMGRTTGKISSSQVANIERDIDNFLETFRKKSSVLDDYNSTSTQNSLVLPAYSSHTSSQCSTDDNTDDSPDKSYYLGISHLTPGQGQGHSRTHRRQISNTTNTSESEWGPDADDEHSNCNQGSHNLPRVVTSSQYTGNTNYKTKY